MICRGDVFVLTYSLLIIMVTDTAIYIYVCIGNKNIFFKQ